MRSVCCGASCDNFSYVLALKDVQIALNAVDVLAQPAPAQNPEVVPEARAMTVLEERLAKRARQNR